MLLEGGMISTTRACLVKTARGFSELGRRRARQSSRRNMKSRLTRALDLAKEFDGLKGEGKAAF